MCHDCYGRGRTTGNEKGRGSRVNAERNGTGGVFTTRYAGELAAGKMKNRSVRGVLSPRCRPPRQVKESLYHTPDRNASSPGVNALHALLRELCCGVVMKIPTRIFQPLHAATKEGTKYHCEAMCSVEMSGKQTRVVGVLPHVIYLVMMILRRCAT